MGDTPATNVNARDSGTMASDTVTPASTCPINEEVSAGAVSAVSVLASSALGDTVSPRTRRHRRVAVRTAMHERPGRGLNDTVAVDEARYAHDGLAEATTRVPLVRARRTGVADKRAGRHATASVTIAANACEVE